MGSKVPYDTMYVDGFWWREGGESGGDMQRAVWQRGTVV